MSTERMSYKVTILGEQYSLVSNESVDHLTSIASLVDTLMKEGLARNSDMDAKKIAVLVSLQLASQLISIKCDTEKKDGQHAQVLYTVERILTTFQP